MRQSRHRRGCRVAMATATNRHEAPPNRGPDEFDQPRLVEGGALDKLLRRREATANNPPAPHVCGNSMLKKLLADLRWCRKNTSTTSESRHRPLGGGDRHPRPCRSNTGVMPPVQGWREGGIVEKNTGSVRAVCPKLWASVYLDCASLAHGTTPGDDE